MKFLLTAVNAKYIHSNPAVYSLRACAGKYQNCVELAEYTVNQPLDEILGDIYLRKPDALGISCYIWNIRYVEELTDALKKVMPQLPIWLGGPEVSYCAEEVLERMPGCTGVMRGEGEKIFRKLLAAYAEGNEDLGRVPGITWRAGDGRILENEAEEPLSLDEAPFLYEDTDQFANKIIYYESSRGCPFSCSYCLSSVDKNVRFRSLPVVLKELRHFLDQRVAQVKFVDRTFNCRKSHCLEIWRYLAEHDNGVTNFHFEIAADLIGEEELEVMKGMRPGLIQLEIGVQSTNPETLREIRRGAGFEKIREVTGRIRSFGNIHQHLDLIAGLPFEDYRSFQKSFNDVYELRPDALQLGFLKVLRGSYMYEKAADYGLLYHDKAPYEVLCTKWLSYGQLLELKDVEKVLEIYYNSGQFRNTMEYLRRFFPDAFSMYHALAEYCRENGFLETGQTRQKRYEILADFAKVLNLGERLAYRSVLVYDLYLRENAKSRPAFGWDQTEQRERIRAFFRQEEEKHTFLQGREGLSAKQMMYDAHVEIFPVDMGKLLSFGEAEEKECAVLFDYRNKNPLRKEAKTWTVELPQ